jgi:hypothetical protein
MLPRRYIIGYFLGLWCLTPLSKRRKPPTFRKSLTHFITQCCIECTSSWTRFELTLLLVIRWVVCNKIIHNLNVSGYLFFLIEFFRKKIEDQNVHMLSLFWIFNWLSRKNISSLCISWRKALTNVLRTVMVVIVGLLDFQLCLTPLSIIFQWNRGGQFYW